MLYSKMATLAVQQSIHSSLADSLSHSLQQLLQTSCCLLKPPVPSSPNSQEMTSPLSLLRCLRPPDRNFFNFHLRHFHIAISNASDSQEDVFFTLPGLSSLPVCLILASTLMILITTVAAQNVLSSQYGPRIGLKSEKTYLWFLFKNYVFNMYYFFPRQA